MLTIVKSLNNNIVLAMNEDNEEIVLFGTGIGFKKKKGDQVDVDQATKLFKAEKDSKESRILQNIPADILTVTEKIIEIGERVLSVQLSPFLLFSLADHIKFSIQRMETEMEIENPLQWEIPHLYHQEYEVGTQALEIIKKDLGVDLPRIEASFIALHFVNAQGDMQNMGDTIQVTQLIKHIVKIIQSLFDVTLDKTTVSYSRFITHIRYFIARQKKGEKNQVPMDDSLKQVIKERYLKSYACGLMIKEMLEKEFVWDITEDELVYLVIHIERLIKENKK